MARPTPEERLVQSCVVRIHELLATAHERARQSVPGLRIYARTDDEGDTIIWLGRNDRLKSCCTFLPHGYTRRMPVVMRVDGAIAEGVCSEKRDIWHRLLRVVQAGQRRRNVTASLPLRND
jgi:hypothetical protein